MFYKSSSSACVSVYYLQGTTRIQLLVGKKRRQELLDNRSALEQSLKYNYMLQALYDKSQQNTITRFPVYL